MRLLCGLRMGQSQRTLPRVPATRTLPRKTTHPPTQRFARVDDKTLCLGATQNAHATSRPAGDAPHNGPRFSRAAKRRRLKAHVGRQLPLANKSSHAQPFLTILLDLEKEYHNQCLPSLRTLSHQV